jgi:hypothetical protein
LSGTAARVGTEFRGERSHEPNPESRITNQE